MNGKEYFLIILLLLGSEYSFGQMSSNNDRTLVSQTVSCVALKGNDNTAFQLQIRCLNEERSCSLEVSEFIYEHSPILHSEKELRSLVPGLSDFTYRFIGSQAGVWSLKRKQEYLKRKENIDSGDMTGIDFFNQSLYESYLLIPDDYFPLASRYRVADDAFPAISLQLLTGDSTVGYMIETGGLDSIANQSGYPVYKCEHVFN